MRHYLPYGLDLKFEYRTYKNIGETYRIDLKAEVNFLYKIPKIIRSISNKKERKYRNFDTFSQWEHYIHEKFNFEKFINQEDCVRYLEKSKRCKENVYNMIGAIVTPIYVVMLTMGITILTALNLFYGFIYMSVILVIVLFVLMVMFSRIKRKIYFLKDFIWVLQNEYTNH